MSLAPPPSELFKKRGKTAVGSFLVFFPLSPTQPRVSAYDGPDSPQRAAPGCQAFFGSAAPARVHSPEPSAAKHSRPGRHIHGLNAFPHATDHFTVPPSLARTVLDCPQQTFPA